MKFDKVLETAFVSYDEIPANLRIDIPVHQKHLLINGELVEWNGPTQLVLSPICLNASADRQDCSFVIGSYPLATAKKPSWR